MKKITLALFSLICLFDSSYGQLNYNHVAPPSNASNSAFRLPNGTPAHAFQRSVMYIHPWEMVPMNSASITSIGVQYLQGTGTTSVVGNFTLYLQNTTDLAYAKGGTFSGAIAGMQVAYIGTYTVPAAAGAATITLPLNPGFTFTGDGLYVAWEFEATGPAAATGTALALCSNNYNGTGFLWIGSAEAAAAPATNTLSGSNFRPALIFNAINTATNEVEVLNIDADGKVSKQIAGGQSVSARVVNSSINAQSSVSVALNVGGANPYTDVQVINNMAAGSIATVNFNAFPSTVSGINTLSVVAILANDQNPANNIKVWTQSVTCDQVGTVPPVATTAFLTTNALGNGTGAGAIISSKYTAPGTASLAGVRLMVANVPANNVGFPITPVLLDAAGTILASGTAVNTTAQMLGAWTTFKFTTPIALTANTDYYIGGSITSQTFYPFSILTDTYSPYFVSPGFYSSPVAGGSVTKLSYDYLGIEAALVFSNTAISVVPSKTVVCKNAGQTVSLTASGLDTYTWTPANGNASVAVVTPTVAQASGVVVYTVIGTDAATGCNSNQSTITLSVSACTGIASNSSNGFNVNLFPNPAVNGKSTISGLVGTNVVTVLNTLGQVVLTQNVSTETTEIDLSSQPSGNYIVRITDSNKESRMVKVVNQN